MAAFLTEVVVCSFKRSVWYNGLAKKGINFGLDTNALKIHYTKRGLA